MKAWAFHKPLIITVRALMESCWRNAYHQCHLLASWKRVRVICSTYLSELCLQKKLGLITISVLTTYHTLILELCSGIQCIILDCVNSNISCSVNSPSCANETRPWKRKSGASQFHHHE